ncbi:MAG: hypothetical protein KDM64_12460, partial [Verrucomicrobiae bacterium]|nr:hypothetical protein [Verrucomicrobiae bacterium]
LEQMIGDRPDLFQAIRDNQVRLAIMAPTEFTTRIPEHRHLSPPEYWDKRARGVGASPDALAVSCGEENLLDYPGDPYAAENILIHEFAHTIHQRGLSVVDPSFQGRLEAAFARAKLKGLWKGKYAGTNPAEYWAEAVQSWFDCNRQNDFEHNHVNTREELRDYDPELAALVESVFGDGKWRYQKPKDRSEPAHLAGYDSGKAPSFSWPKELVAAYDAIQRGDRLEHLPELPLAPLESGEARSPKSGEQVKLRIDNQTKDTVRLFWIDFDGERKEYGQADPGRSFDQNTFAGHLWLATDPKGHPLALFAAGSKPGLAVVR